MRLTHRLTVVALLLAAGLTGGCADDSSAAQDRETGAETCRAQFRALGEQALGKDAQSTPSGLAARWRSITATIASYESSARPADCGAPLADLTDGIAALDEFSATLRSRDMAYQLSVLQAPIDAFLAGDVPRSANAPSVTEVQEALQILTANAAAADADLSPAWGALATVDLDSSAATSAAIAELDNLAADSPTWQACKEALAVLLAARADVEGGTPTPVS